MRYAKTMFDGAVVAGLAQLIWGPLTWQAMAVLVAWTAVSSFLGAVTFDAHPNLSR